MSDTLRARFDAYQKNPACHPLTCGGGGGPCSGVRLAYAREDETGLTLRCPQCGHEQLFAARSLFHDMLVQRPEPGDVTVASVLTPAHAAALRQVIAAARCHYEEQYPTSTRSPEVQLARQVARALERAVARAQGGPLSGAS